MDVNTHYQKLAEVFEASISHPERIKEAESFLKTLTGKANFCLCMVKVIQQPQIKPTIKQACVVYLKNYVKKYWVTDDGSTVIQDSEKNELRKIFTDTSMLSLPPRIRKQIFEIISLISDHDFPEKWPSLLPALVSKFNNSDINIIIGVLKTLNAVLKRYASAFHIPQTLKELKYILGELQEPFFKIYNTFCGYIDKEKGNEKTLHLLLKGMNLILKIFYSLNAVDLPEHFEDHLDSWMKGFQYFLTFRTSFQSLLENPNSEESPGILHKVQSSVCKNLNLYIEKYEEEFKRHLPDSCKNTLELLVSCGSESHYDALVISCIMFLTSVSRSVFSQLFASNLSQICEKVVVPNIKFREADEFLFEDDPLAYIKKDMEGSDLATRRRAACDMIRGLRRSFEKEITQLLSGYVSHLLKQYSQNPQNNWREKDSAIYLITALAAHTTGTNVKTTNKLVNIDQFFKAHIATELENSSSSSAVVKADAIKFVISFRRDIKPQDFNHVFPLLIKHLGSNNFVVHSYAASAIEHILKTKEKGNDGNYHHIYPISNIKSNLKVMLDTLFKVLDMPQSKENEYVMKCIMRIVSLAKEDVLDCAKDSLVRLNGKLSQIYKAPTSYAFSHYLYETVASLITTLCSKQRDTVKDFESLFYPIFQEILKEDVSEYTPYVFQIMSLLLEFRGKGLTQHYQAILPFLVRPSQFENRGNVPAIVRLLQAFFKADGNYVVSSGNLEPILGVFQKLISSKTMDHLGFFLMEAIVEHLEISVLERYIPTVFKLCFTRLMNSKTLSFMKSFIIFIAFFIGKRGPDYVVTKINEAAAPQKDIFMMVLKSVWIENVQKVSGALERKICSIAMIKLLCECPKMLQQPYMDLWLPLLAATLRLFEEGQDTSTTNDSSIQAESFDDAPTSTNVFSQLVNAPKPQGADPFPNIKDPKIYLAQSLFNLSSKIPGKIPSIISRLPSQLQQLISVYLKQAQINQPLK